MDYTTTCVKDFKRIVTLASIQIRLQQRRKEKKKQNDYNDYARDWTTG